jgi:PhnB protein
MNMAATSIYLNFNRETEEVFTFYKKVFGTDFDGGIMRFSEMPRMEGQPPIGLKDQSLVLHVSLPILGGTKLMGSDVLDGSGLKVSQGNAFYIMLEPDTRAEADRLFAALSKDGAVEMPMEDAFWGDYFGAFSDRFGVKWMIACPGK